MTRTRCPNHPGEPYARADLNGPWDVIVIGSGLGGLAAAALLARHGKQRVLVLERHYRIGGYTHVFKRPGFEWDVGIHYIGEIEGKGAVVGRLFDEISEGRLEWSPLGDVYDRIVLGDAAYDLPAGPEAFVEKLGDHFPSERDSLCRYLALLEEMHAALPGYMSEKAIPRPVARIAGPWLRRRYLRHAKRTTRSVLEEIFSDPTLLGVVTGQYADFGLPPGRSSFAAHALIARHYLHGAYYPVGGSARIAESIAPTIERTGGKLCINAEVGEVLLDRGRALGVRMSDGREIRARRVVSDAGIPNTCGRLLQDESWASELAAAHPASMAHVALYLGLEGSTGQLGLARANIFACPSEDHDRSYAAYEADPDSPFPVVYISFPSAKDPAFEERHPGRSTVDVVAPAAFSTFAPWADARWKRRGEEYEALKDRTARRLLDVVYRFVPQVRDRIVYRELSTPVTTRHFTNHPSGECYGLEHNPERFTDRRLCAETPVRNLFLTGQDIVSCGAGGALAGGTIAASAILRRNLFARIMRKR